MSIGGTIKTKKDAIEDVVCYVDQLMYQAKNKKDEVVVYQEGEKQYLHTSVQENIKQQILIVDDSMMNRELLSVILEDDYRILEAKDGQECLNILYKNKEDIALVLLDINMPVLDGFEVLRAMNENQMIEDVPVIMISSEDSEEAIRRAYDLEHQTMLIDHLMQGLFIDA